MKSLLLRVIRGVLLLVICFKASAQFSSKNTIVLRTQKQVNNFAQTTTVNGNLIITGKNIQQINLPLLTSVSGSFQIINNPALTSIYCQNLKKVGRSVWGGDLLIESNKTLVNIAFPSITVIHGALNIRHNQSIVALEAFPQLESVSAFILEENNNLKNITRVNSFATIGYSDTFSPLNGSLIIAGNDALTNLNFLLSVQEIKGRIFARIEIQKNNSLNDLYGLHNVRMLNGKITFINISGNKGLKNINALRKFTTVGKPLFLIVKDNPQLNWCCGIYDFVKNQPNRHIILSGNGSDCNRGTILEEGACISSGLCFESITLSSQEQVDNFRQNYGCPIVFNLNISGDDITNLDGLSDITAIYSGIGIYNNPQLTDITGLQSISILEAPELQFVSGMNISNNSMLENLDGLNGLKYIMGSLRIADNDKLKNINGLSNVRQISIGQVLIENNPSLSSIGLTSLTEILTPRGSGQRFAINNNDALTDLKGLSAFQRMGGYNTTLEIMDNDALTTMDDFTIDMAAFQSTPTVRISDNEVLSSIDGFTLSISAAPLGELYITNNPTLALCCSMANILLNHTPVSTIDISGNKPSCTFEEITREGGPCAGPTVADAFTVYPNPTTGLAHINIINESEGYHSLEVRDYTGNVVHQSTFTTEHGNGVPIDIQNSPPGLYSIIIYDREGVLGVKRLQVDHQP